MFALLLMLLIIYNSYFLRTEVTNFAWKHFALLQITGHVLIFVTDQGSNIVAAISLLIAERLNCVLHCFYNLIYTDLSKYSKSLKDLIQKLHMIYYLQETDV